MTTQLERGWDDVSDTDIREFSDLVYRLRDRLLPVDDHGDHVVQVILVDRRRYEPIQVQPLPRDRELVSGEELESIVDTAIASLNAAASRLRTLITAKKPWERVQ